MIVDGQDLRARRLAGGRWQTRAEPASAEAIARPQAALGGHAVGMPVGSKRFEFHYAGLSFGRSGAVALSSQARGGGRRVGGDRQPAAGQLQPLVARAPTPSACRPAIARASGTETATWSPSRCCPTTGKPGGSSGCSLDVRGRRGVDGRGGAEATAPATPQARSTAPRGRAGADPDCARYS